MKFAVRSLLMIAVFSILLLVLNILLFSTPKYKEKLCPSVQPVYYYGRASSYYYSNKTSSPRKIVDCKKIFSGDIKTIKENSGFEWCDRPEDILDEEFIEIAKDCEHFKKQGGFFDHVTSEEEKSFPIAFSILMYESVEQTVRLLSAIYRPQNLYCIHVDDKAHWKVQEAIRQVSNCFPNVVVPKEFINVRWAEFPLVEAELKCLHLLWNHTTKWKYYINLTGREYPLKTNWELVQILKAYNGANDIDGTLHKRPILWTQFVWRNENWRTSEKKSDPPHNFLIAKGSGHIAASREYIDFALHDNKSLDLLEWMKNIRAPDEHFFQTLNHNPQLNIPGAYKGDPDLKYFFTRFKVWQSETEQCHGKWIRYICNFGVGDLPRMVTAKEMFVNKFRLEQDPVAFMCMEQWYKNRTTLDGTSSSSLNISFYKQLPFVKNHV